MGRSVKKSRNMINLLPDEMSRHAQQQIRRLAVPCVNSERSPGRRYDNQQRRKQPGSKFSLAAAAASTVLDARLRTSRPGELPRPTRTEDAFIYRFDYNGLTRDYIAILRLLTFCA